MLLRSAHTQPTVLDLHVVAVSCHQGAVSQATGPWASLASWTVKLHKELKWSWVLKSDGQCPLLHLCCIILLICDVFAHVSCLWWTQLSRPALVQPTFQPITVQPTCSHPVKLCAIGCFWRAELQNRPPPDLRRQTPLQTDRRTTR